jgi:GAF domain-containing protein
MIKLFKRKPAQAPIEAPSPTVDLFADARTLAEVIEILRRSARAIAQADGITVVMRDRDEVCYMTEDAIAPLWSGQRFAIRSCVTGLAILGNEPIVIPDIATDPRVPLHLYLATFVQSLAVFPIGHDCPTMALGLYWKIAAPPPQDALDRIAALARAAGDAIARIEADSRTHAA